MADYPVLTTAGLRAQLAATRPPSDPTAVIMPPGSERWPPSMQEQLTGTLKPAGVLVPIIDRPVDGLSLLLTRRAAELKHHAGQVSFPGGRMEPNDIDIEATALRETYEEVGIASSQVAILGYLAPMPTVTGYAVTPVVGLVEPTVELKLDPLEVESAFEVPIEYLLEPASRKLAEREIHGRKMQLVEFHYAGRRIWGATAFIILQFLEIIKKQ